MNEAQEITFVFPAPFRRWHAKGPEDGEPGNRKDRAGDGSGSIRKLRVVIVDDEMAIAETLVEILNNEGFEADGACTGEDAIKLVQTFKPDVVISDVVMPGMNGVEIGIRIRELLPSCRVILFSGQAATVDLLKRARENGNEFEILAKPIRPDILISIIRARGGVQ